MGSRRRKNGSDAEQERNKQYIAQRGAAVRGREQRAVGR